MLRDSFRVTLMICISAFYVPNTQLKKKIEQEKENTQEYEKNTY